MSQLWVWVCVCKQWPKMVISFCFVGLCFVNTEKGTNAHRIYVFKISPKQTMPAVNIVFHIEAKYVFITKQILNKKISRKWMQPSKMHCWFFFGFASSRYDEIAQYMKNFRLFVLVYILVCIRLLSQVIFQKKKTKKWAAVEDARAKVIFRRIFVWWWNHLR